MKLALKELLRRPGRFVLAAVVLTLISLLFMLLGGLLDGLIASSTGAYRAQPGDLIVYSAKSEKSLVRSRITTEDRAAIDKAQGVKAVGGLGSIPGAVVGALTIGVAEELSLLSLAPAYRTAVGFVAILVVLTLRPRGILGERAY